MTTARRDRQATLTRFAAVLVWLLWGMNVLNDLLQTGRPSPFTLVMLAALLSGQMLIWLGVVPNPMPRRWATATLAATGIVIFALLISLLVRLLLRG